MGERYVCEVCGSRQNTVRGWVYTKWSGKVPREIRIVVCDSSDCLDAALDRKGAFA